MQASVVCPKEHLFGDDEELVNRLPDSMLVHCENRTLLAKSSAMLCLMRRLGGLWRMAAWALRLVPTVIRDLFYDFVARRRLRWFRPPEDACPLIAEQDILKKIGNIRMQGNNIKIKEKWKKPTKK